MEVSDEITPAQLKADAMASYVKNGTHNHPTEIETTVRPLMVAPFVTHCQVVHSATAAAHLCKKQVAGSKFSETRAVNCWPNGEAAHEKRN